jgi:galacturan 1,4-alpha-galacturonidase
LTIYEATNSEFRNLRFINSQMWTVTVHTSSHILLSNITVNSTSTNRNPARNTDGADTLFSNNITFRGWDISNSDDAIALKANSTNILIEDCVFRRGQGLALGSIGQYPGVYETIENVVARNLTLIGTKYAGYVKTWTGVQKGYPPNGGGGGIGVIRNISLSFHLRSL